VSAVAQELTTSQVEVACPACVDLPFDPVTDPGEASFRAGLHNQLQHGGARIATAVPAEADQATAGAPQIASVSGLGWALSPSVFEDACAQAVPYAGDQTADGRAWSARVDAAVAGMDVIDPAGLDTWMDTHAASDVPHLVEAGLVAAWETHVRGLFEPNDELADQNDLTTGSNAIQAVEAVDDWDATDGWD
jgi:hypothetical protein